VELDEETDCFFLDRLKQSISKFTTKRLLKWINKLTRKGLFVCWFNN
jgi:hypothetical protein